MNEIIVNSKRKTNGYSQVKANAKRNRKRREAEDRQATWDDLPLDEKLKRMGKKHRARWDRQQAELAKRKVKVPAPVATSAVEVKPAVEVKVKKQSKKKIVEMAKAQRPAKS